MLLKLKRAGFDAALAPRDWEKSAAGNVTVGARAAAWTPIPKVDSVLVLDEHDESYQEEAAPTWNARDVAIERAKRDGSPWVVASSCPSLEMLTSHFLKLENLIFLYKWVYNNCVYEQILIQRCFHLMQLSQ